MTLDASLSRIVLVGAAMALAGCQGQSSDTSPGPSGSNTATAGVASPVSNAAASKSGGRSSTEIASVVPPSGSHPSALELAAAGSVVVYGPPPGYDSAPNAGPNVVVEMGPARGDTERVSNAARVLARARLGIRACYSTALSRTPGQRGRIELDLRIDSEGRVTSVQTGVTGNLSTALVACTRQQAKTMRFEPPQGGTGAKLLVSIALQPR